jgi:hypothetical protein
MIESILRCLNSYSSIVIEFKHGLGSEYNHKPKQAFPLTLNRTLTCSNNIILLSKNYRSVLIALNE